MSADPDSSVGLPGRAGGGNGDVFPRDEVGEDPDDSDYEDVEELFLEEMEDVVEEEEVEVELGGKAEGGVRDGVDAEGEEGDARKAEVVEEVVEKKVGEVEAKDDEPCVTKAATADDGTKKSLGSGSVVNHVSSPPHKCESNPSSSSQARDSTQSACMISSKECGFPTSRQVNRKTGKNKSKKKARHKKASHSKALAFLRNKKPDGAVQPLDKVNKGNSQTPKCFHVPSAQTAPRRPSSSLGMDETALKKPAIICDFFAKGWCIKGNACRFLHVKDGAAVAGSMGEIRKSKQPTPYELLGSGSDQSSKDTSVRQRTLIQAYGGEFCDSKGSYNIDCEGPLGTRLYHDIASTRCSSKDEYQDRQHLKQDMTYQEAMRRNTHDAQHSRMSYLTGSSAFHEREHHSVGPSSTRDPYQSGSNDYTFGKSREDCRAQYEQYHYLPYEYRSYSLTSSMDSSYSNPHSSLRSSPPVHTFSQSVRAIHSSAILESEHGNNERVDCDGGYDGSSYIPRISSPYYSKFHSRTSVEKDISADVPPSIEHKSAVPENTWETSVPFRSSFCSTSLGNPLPSGQHGPLHGVEPQMFVATSASQRLIGHKKSDQLVNDELSGENLTSGCREQKPTNSFSSKSCEDVFDKTSVHGVNSYPIMLSVSRNGSIDEVEISIPENKAHKIHNPHDDLSNTERVLGARVTNEVEKVNSNMESKALRIFRVALVDFIKEMVKPAWKDGQLSKDGHKIVVKRSVDKVISTLQPHEVPSDAESINNFLSTSRSKVMKLVEAYMGKYAMYSSAEGNKLL